MNEFESKRYVSEAPQAPDKITRHRIRARQSSISAPCPIRFTRRGLILTKADATLIEDAQSWPLFTNRWKSGDISPAGNVAIGSFHLDYSAPVWTYEVGYRQIEARIWI